MNTEHEVKGEGREYYACMISSQRVLSFLDFLTSQTSKIT